MQRSTQEASAWPAADDLTEATLGDLLVALQLRHPDASAEAILVNVELYGRRVVELAQAMRAALKGGR